MFRLYGITMVDDTDQCLNIELILHSLNQPHLAMVYYSFHMSLHSVGWYFVENVCISNEDYWSVVFILLSSSGFVTRYCWPHRLVERSSNFWKRMNRISF